jgi:hypothetical protein
MNRSREMMRVLAGTGAFLCGMLIHEIQRSEDMWNCKPAISAAGYSSATVGAICHFPSVAPEKYSAERSAATFPSDIPEQVEYGHAERDNEQKRKS